MDGSKHSGSAVGQGPFRLVPLPFSHRALAPSVSETTLRTHHGVHHATYVKKANELSRKAGLATLGVEEIIRRAHADESLRPLYHNAAQSWNHDFYWRCLSPQPPQAQGELRAAIVAAFGSTRSLVTALVDAGVEQFASGWVWLTCDAAGKLAVTSTGNADSPLTTDARALLTFDVWEHAYYLDYRQDRKAHLKSLISGHANWGFAQERWSEGRAAAPM